MNSNTASAPQFVWVSTSAPYDGNVANIAVYLQDGIIRPTNSYDLHNSLAKNICNQAINAKPNSFISRIEILQAKNEASRLFPADYMLAKVDKAIKDHTGFADMADLLRAKGNYRPTLYTNAAPDSSTRNALRLIADYYDACMEQIGDSRRAYRV